MADPSLTPTATLPLMAATPSISSPAAYLNPQMMAGMPFAGGSPFGAAGDPFAAGQQFQSAMPQMMNTPGIGLPGNLNTGAAPTGPAPVLTGL